MRINLDLDCDTDDLRLNAAFSASQGVSTVALEFVLEQVRDRVTEFDGDRTAMVTHKLYDRNTDLVGTLTIQV